MFCRWRRGPRDLPSGRASVPAHSSQKTKSRSLTVNNQCEANIPRCDSVQKEIESRKVTNTTSCGVKSVLEGLKTVISLNRVEATGAHGRNTERFVTFLSKSDIKRKLIQNSIELNMWNFIKGFLQVKVLYFIW